MGTKSIHCKRARARECRALGFLIAYQPLCGIQRKQMPALGSDRLGVEDQLLLSALFPAASPSAPSEPHGSWSVSGKHGSLLGRLARMKSQGTQRASHFYYLGSFLAPNSMHASEGSCFQSGIPGFLSQVQLGSTAVSAAHNVRVWRLSFLLRRKSSG